MKKINKLIIPPLIALIFLCKGIIVDATNNTRIHIEYPNNSKVTTSLNVSGWVMSKEENTVKVYINNQEIINVERTSRNDVLNAIKDYGDITTNPTPGFRKEIDMTGYKDGNYQLKVKVVDKNNNTIAEENKTITVSKYNGLINIEDPSTKVVGTNLSIGGWVMSNNPNAILKLYIDNTEITNIDRNTRNDVIKAITGYGDSNTNKTPGFKKIIDATSLKDGKHTVKAQIVNGVTNEVITEQEKSFTLEKYKYKMNLEEPNINNVQGTQMKIGGWVMTTTNDVSIRAYIDGQEITSIARIERKDVIKAITGYGDAKTNPTPGFTKEIDLSTFDDGSHTLKVQLVQTATNEVLTEEIRKFNLEKYKSLLNVEDPSTSSINSNSLTVSGWMMSKNINATIKIYIDDQEKAPVSRIRRQDVINTIKGYGDITTNPLPGFKQVIDMSAIKDGTHTIKVRVIDSKTNALMSEEIKKITLKKYKSKLSIEDPSKNSIAGNNLTVGGWVMSTDKNATIQILIDNDVIPNVARLERKDVIKAVTDYGDITTNPTPGFKQVVDLTLIKDGTHKVIVRLIDTITNEVIGETQRSVTVKKYKTTGVIESPKTTEIVAGLNLKLAGWIMSTAPNRELQLFIDGKEVSNKTITTNARSDVIKAVTNYGDITTNRTPGYAITTDMSSYKDGAHTVEVRIIDANTNEILSTIKQQINLKKYKGTLTVESPVRSTFNNGFTVSGWEMSELDNSYIKVYIDEREQNLKMERTSRGDVINQIKDYGDVTVNQTPGFSTDLDLTNIAAGDHKLTVRLYSKLDEELAKYEKKIVVYKNIYFGMDVSSYQQKINWTSVKNEGIDFAIVRLGFRGYGTPGTLNLDMRYEENVKGAIANNINLGIYFYSQAINEQEAVEEANFVLNHIRLAGIQNSISYPVIFDTEFTDAKPNGRADGLSKDQRTRVAKAFLNTIKQAGYIPMVYASKYFLYDNVDMNVLSEYDVWVAHYNGTPDPAKVGTDYTGAYHMWQYTSTGHVNGVNGNVDLNISYKKYR